MRKLVSCFWSSLHGKCFVWLKFHYFFFFRRFVSSFDLCSTSSGGWAMDIGCGPDWHRCEVLQNRRIIILVISPTQAHTRSPRRREEDETARVSCRVCRQKNPWFMNSLWISCHFGLSTTNESCVYTTVHRWVFVCFVGFARYPKHTPNRKYIFITPLGILRKQFLCSSAVLQHSIDHEMLNNIRGKKFERIY